MVAPINRLGQIAHVCLFQTLSEISHDAPHRSVGSALAPDFVEKLFPSDVTVGAMRERLEQLKRKRKAQIYIRV